MLLAVDIGNTNICIGILEQDTVRFTARMVTRPRCTADEYTAELKFLLRRLNVDASQAEGVIVCSVVPGLTHPLAEACQRLTGHSAMLVSVALDTGLTMDVDEPQQVGQDRLADAAAAAAHYPLPCMTVDLGTATTYNVIGTGGVFLGGFIVPGVQTSLRAISAGTAQLPPIAPETPGQLIGKNTVACLNNGAMFGTAAMLDGLADRVEQDLGQPLTVVATGGLAPYIMPCCKRKIHYDADLLFHGLALLYEKNKG
ncbi:type III pantothenate kinase [Subdoligranulum sp. DSM 109015]|uniref:Type III pantothenate kinase n=1 Tax=Gemmiger gallinarum TaxID=2779354 RepID=A0ABR9R028_9FIRM|nr:type III pantothenate kinase [Gemmiger gallinarum]MBE5036488.1 type III pantothenate kinase [Gemmiger gallinarum]